MYSEASISRNAATAYDLAWDATPSKLVSRRVLSRQAPDCRQARERTMALERTCARLPALKKIPLEQRLSENTNCQTVSATAAPRCKAQAGSPERDSKARTIAPFQVSGASVYEEVHYPPKHHRDLRSENNCGTPDEIRIKFEVHVSVQECRL